MKRLVFAALMSASLPAIADTPQQMLAGYSAEAAGEQPGFSASAERGREFYLKRRDISEKMPNCSSCHTESPSAEGTHVITSKAIQPLSPSINEKRFTDKTKVEKWFRRNCKEVVGRACTPAEKADLIQFILTRK